LWSVTAIDEEEDVGSYCMTLRKGEDASEEEALESSLWKSLWTCRETNEGRFWQLTASIFDTIVLV
jgi:hypothetical protein